MLLDKKLKSDNEKKACKFFDVHSHADEMSNELLKVTRKLGICQISVSTDADSSRKNLNRFGRFCFVGIHPSRAELSHLHEIREIADLALGIGEIGLDPVYGNQEEQEKCFIEQLEIAENLRKPVQVHSRNSFDRCLELILSYNVKKVLFHWFEREDRVDKINTNGFYASFGPSIVYSKKLKRIAGKINRELILTETDYPVTFKPLYNTSGPVLLPSVVFELSQTLKNSFDETAALLVQNTMRYIGNVKELGQG